MSAIVCKSGASKGDSEVMVRIRRHQGCEWGLGAILRSADVLKKLRDELVKLYRVRHGCCFGLDHMGDS